MAISTIGTNSLSDPIAVNGYTPTASNMQPFNRIINGAMTIDQRNAGAAVTPAHGGWTLDRWECFNNPGGKFSVQQNAGSVTPPAGFANYFGVTSLSSYTVTGGETFTINTKIEGFNFSDMAWGTASATPITLSFWVRSSLTGTFGGALRNSSDTRSYPFAYTINSPTTWEYKTITISGDTTGTWVGATNGVGLRLHIGLGVGPTYSGTAGAWAAANYVSATGATSVVGTSGATFYITGVQLEAGSTASPFAHENYGDTLRKCQRYYQKYTFSGGGVITIGECTSTSAVVGSFQLNQEMRTSPSITIPSAGATGMSFLTADGSWPSAFGSISVSNISNINFKFSQSGAGGYSLGNASWLYPANYVNILANAEL